MLGDGCLSLVYGKKKFIAISGNSRDDVSFFNNIIKVILMKLIDKDIPIKFKKMENTIELNFIDNKLFDFINSFGFPIGKKGDKLFIPKIFYDEGLVKYVLRGFFATDGSLVLTENNGILYPRVEANGIAQLLIKEISDFLNLNAIKCNFYKTKRKNWMWKQQYRIQINGKDNLEKFKKLIGFINNKQIEKLNYYYNKSGSGEN